MLGKPLMPWQQQVADVGGEIDPDTGLFAYREVWWSVMRQSGKTELGLAWEVHRCVAPFWDEPQRVVYTAQTGWEAQKKLLEDQVPLVERSPFGKLITRAGGGRVRRAQGNWGVDFGTGSKIDVLGSTLSAGHGAVVDLGTLDEVWKDEDDRREQSILPAMVTRPWGQLIGYSTMGTDASVYLNRKVETGRAAASADSGTGMAYLEWSIPNDADIASPDVWWEHMPALGWTISETAVQHAFDTMTEAEFRRAFCNQRRDDVDVVIPPGMWAEVQDPAAAPGAGVTFGVDLDNYRDAWSVAASDGESVEVIDHGGVRPLAWFAEKESRRNHPVVIDKSGPAAALADGLEDLGVTVVYRSRDEVANICGRLVDAVADQKVRVRPSETLDAAVNGVRKKPHGDRFVWSRSASSADVTPLFAVSLALSHQQEDKAGPRIRLLGG